MIRGENIANPILILLHVGPGFPEMRLLPTFSAALEQHYIVVYWMQRDTSKSFDRGMPASSLTIEQFIADLDELIDIVRRRFGKTNVAIYGHSWGSVCSMLRASRRKWLPMAVPDRSASGSHSKQPPIRSFLRTRSIAGTAMLFDRYEANPSNGVGS